MVLDLCRTRRFEPGRSVSWERGEETPMGHQGRADACCSVAHSSRVEKDHLLPVKAQKAKGRKGDQRNT